jgi:hypothetical protein
MVEIVPEPIIYEVPIDIRERVAMVNFGVQTLDI